MCVLTNHRSGGFRLQAFSEFVRKIFYDFDCFYRISFVFHQITALFFLRCAEGCPS